MMKAWLFGPHVFTNVNKPGRPFEAQYRAWRLQAGARRSSTGRIYRDSPGRLRRDVEMDGVLVASAISDPVAGRHIGLNHIERLYSESSHPFEDALRSALPGPDAERQVVNGMECLRLRVGDRLDAWISPDLDFLVREHVKDETGEGTWELYDVVLGEPDAKLFDVPAGYRRTARLDEG